MIHGGPVASSERVRTPSLGLVGMPGEHTATDRSEIIWRLTAKLGLFAVAKIDVGAVQASYLLLDATALLV